jgi:hypothetical protein
MAEGWPLCYPTHRTKTKTSDGWGTRSFISGGSALDPTNKKHDGRWKDPMAEGWPLCYPTHRTKTETSDGWGTRSFISGGSALDPTRLLLGQVSLLGQIED